jgi:hypothetical protein
MAHSCYKVVIAGINNSGTCTECVPNFGSTGQSVNDVGSSPGLLWQSSSTTCSQVTNLAFNANGFNRDGFAGASDNNTYLTWTGSGWDVQFVGAGYPYPGMVLSIDNPNFNGNCIWGSTATLTTCDGSTWNPTSTGYRFAGTYSGSGWSNPSNAGADDSSYATDFAINNDIFYAKNWGWSIPSNATITGIAVKINRHSSGGAVGDLSAYLTFDGTTAGNPVNFAPDNLSWSGSDSVLTLGSSDCLWGMSSITPAQVNASTFGYRMTVKGGSGAVANIDSISMCIWYIGGTQSGSGILSGSGGIRSGSGGSSGSGFSSGSGGKSGSGVSSGSGGKSGSGILSGSGSGILSGSGSGILSGSGGGIGLYGSATADSLRIYHTGDCCDGCDDVTQGQSLGRYRSATEVQRIGILQNTAINGVLIGEASGNNGLGAGSIFAVGGNSVWFSAPNGSPGTTTALTVGTETTLYDGTDPTKWVRVARTSSSTLTGIANLEFHPVFNNVFAMNNAEDAESSAGSNKYRAVMCRNEATGPLLNVSAYVLPLGSSVVCSSGLPSSGSGAIYGDFCGFPAKGWVAIANGAVLREIVYYSSRTDSALTVPSLGRARLGTTASAGTSGDTITPVPNIRIGWEWAEPFVAGSIQTIANENTSPFINFTTGTLNIGWVLPNEQFGLWIHRELPGGVGASAKVENSIGIRFTAPDGTVYNDTLAGLYRIAVDSLDRYELHVGTDAEPDLSSPPTDTFTSLPYNTTTPLAPGHQYHLITNKRNRWDLVSQGTQSTVIVLDGNGNQIEPPPSAPIVVSWSPASSGRFILRAVYYYTVDDPAVQADEFALYFRFDGTNPNPATDNPVIIAGTRVDGAMALNYSTGSYSVGSVGKVLVRTLRSSDFVESTNTDIHTATSAASNILASSIDVFWRGVAMQAFSTNGLMVCSGVTSGIQSGVGSGGAG